MTTNKNYFEEILQKEGNKLTLEYKIEEKDAIYIIGNLIAHNEMGDYRNYFTKLFANKEGWEAIAINAHLKHVRNYIISKINKIDY